MAVQLLVPFLVVAPLSTVLGVLLLVYSTRLSPETPVLPEIRYHTFVLMILLLFHVSAQLVEASDPPLDVVLVFGLLRFCLLLFLVLNLRNFIAKETTNVVQQQLRKAVLATTVVILLLGFSFSVNHIWSEPSMFSLLVFVAAMFAYAYMMQVCEWYEKQPSRELTPDELLYREVEL